MKIAFITGCLESGRDGIGDYTRLLARECVSQGYECCLLSLNDHFLTEISQSEVTADEVKIPMLRLPVSMPWNQRTAHAENFLALCQPDWVSLQFVPYAFQEKGIVIGLSKWLRPLVQGRQLHIMFHELWIGHHVGAKLKERLIGTVQKFFILRLVKHLQPIVLHTSNLAYVAMLQQLGISASRLPMFGAIPIAEKNGDNWLFPKLQKLGLDIKTENRNQFWLFGFFGTLHPTWPAEPLFTYLNQAGIQHQRRIAFISVGRLGTGEMLWESLSNNYSSQFVFLRLGEQLPNKISEVLNSIDFGITPTPYLLTGKSGTIAALLEHGLPVIVNDNGFQFASCPMLTHSGEKTLHLMDSSLPNQISHYVVNRKPAQSRLQCVAIQFLEDLSNLSKTKCNN